MLERGTADPLAEEKLITRALFLWLPVHDLFCLPAQSLPSNQEFHLHSCIAGVSQGSSFGSGLGISPLTMLSQTHLFPVPISPFPFSFTVSSIVLCQCHRSGARRKAIAPPQEGEQTLINYNEESGSSFSEVSVTAFIHTTPPVLCGWMCCCSSL